ncbi:MAG: radical SAM protein [Nitrospirae bacterium]|nr:radical SAM protein [Nitrospirota bacterium]
MRCALIIPSWVPEDIFSSGTAGSQINYWQPLGTLYVASSIIKAGHEVIFLNGAFMKHPEILDEISNYQPEFVGLYSTTFGWKKAVFTASEIRRITSPLRPYIAVGGPYPIAMQEKCLIDAPEIDAVVTGEGEITVVELLDRLGKGSDLAGVKGVVYREGHEIKKNPPRPLITDMDSIVFPARELLGDAKDYIPPPATYKRRPVAVIMTSRGCSRRCIYCFQIDKQRKSGVRFRSVENVIQEIELCIRQGYREIKFIDDTLAADYDRAMKIAQEIKARKLDFTWFASACVNQVDKPLLRAFKDAGCWAILLGAESGVQKNLNTIRKGITLEQTRKAVKAAKDAGLTVYTPFIFGIPGETFEDGLKIAKYGHMSEELTDFTYQGAAFVPYSMTRHDIAVLRQTAFRKFYSRPSFIAKRILGLRSANDCVVAFKSLKSLFSLWTKNDLFGKHNKSF